MTTSPDFLTNANKHLDDGIRSYRNDRAKKPGLSDGEFVHGFGNEMVTALNLGVINPTEVALSLAVAMHRLATMTCPQDDDAECL